MLRVGALRAQQSILVKCGQDRLLVEVSVHQVLTYVVLLYSHFHFHFHFFTTTKIQQFSSCFVCSRCHPSEAKPRTWYSSQRIDSRTYSCVIRSHGSSAANTPSNVLVLFVVVYLGIYVQNTQFSRLKWHSAHRSLLLCKMRNPHRYWMSTSEKKTVVGLRPNQPVLTYSYDLHEHL